MSILMTDIRLTKRGFLVITILSFSILSWYALFSLYILRYVAGLSAETYPLVNASFNFIIAITLLLSSFFIHRIRRMRTIFNCFSAILIATILLLFTSSTIFRLMIIFIAGVFFSIGQLASFAYFWDLTVSEERGRASGLIGFFVLPIYYIVLGMAETFDFSGTLMVGVVLSLGTLATKLLSPERKEMLTTKRGKKEHHPEKRTILLYSFPWALFCLINATLARNVSLHVLQVVPLSLYTILVVLQLIAAVFGALGGGMLSDLFGRKLPLIFSLTLYGISSALVGLVENYEMLYFVYFANGLNWGILWVMYSFVVWADLSNKESCIKIYSIGLIIFYSANGVGSLLAHQISQIPIIVSSLLSCLFIFLSNIVLLLAPELLSPDFRQKIKLKLHMSVIKRVRKQPQNQG